MPPSKRMRWASALRALSGGPVKLGASAGSRAGLMCVFGRGTVGKRTLRKRSRLPLHPAGPCMRCARTSRSVSPNAAPPAEPWPCHLSCPSTPASPTSTRCRKTLRAGSACSPRLASATPARRRSRPARARCWWRCWAASWCSSCTRPSCATTSSLNERCLVTFRAGFRCPRHAWWTSSRFNCFGSRAPRRPTAQQPGRAVQALRSLQPPGGALWPILPGCPGPSKQASLGSR